MTRKFSETYIVSKTKLLEALNIEGKSILSTKARGDVIEIEVMV